MLAALRLGLYELLYLSGSPDRAVVADAVELAKAAPRRRSRPRQRRAAPGRARGRGGAARRRSATRRPSRRRSSTPIRSGSRGCGGSSSGADGARALMACDNEPSEVALRANTLVDRRRGARRASCARPACETHRDPLLPEARRAGGPARRARLGAVAAGRVSRAVARGDARRARARAAAPASACSTCARRPGGKTTHLAALMQGDGRGAGGRAQPPPRGRAGAHGRSGCARQRARRGRPTPPPAHGGSALRPRARRSALLGPGNAAGARRSALARERRTRSPSWPRCRRAILAAGAEALRPGGVLVYSTCTISPTENEHVIANFLDSHADFSLDDLAARSARVRVARGPPASAPRLPGTVLTLPHRDDTAGFFIARLRRS